ncbi:MAG: hypothetical protein KC620_10330, partial [Myxococcales bacterium]|nr:hypothetical protein [Myxococcales bacterium]
FDLKMLAHHGYALAFGACLVSGAEPDGISLRAGGAVRCAAATRLDDVSPVPPPALAALAGLARGESEPRLAPAHRPAVRRAFERVWSEVTGRTLRTARFLET